MNRSFVRFLLVFVTASTLFAVAPGQAAGLRLYEISTTEIALAGSGSAARAQDAATLYTNPAGMTRLQGSQTLLSLQPLYADVSLTPDSSTTVAGGDGGNPIGVFPGLSAFHVRSPTDRLSWGLGVVGNFGLALEYDDGWVGRYHTQDITLAAMTFLPAVAYRISDLISVGGEIQAMYGVFSTTVAVNNLAPGLADGALEIDDSTWGFGVRLGALLEPSSETRIGFVYNSRVNLDFDDVPEFRGLGPGMQAVLESQGLIGARVDLAMESPQGVMTSFYQQIGERWSILGNVGWEDWSEFGKVGVEISTDTPTTVTANRNYQDTWHAGVGSQRAFTSWIWSLGLSYDSAMVEDEFRTVDLPLGDGWRLGVGAWRPRPSGMDLSFAYELLWGGDLPVDQYSGPLSGRVSGTYEQSMMHFFSVSFGWGS